MLQQKTCCGTTPTKNKSLLKLVFIFLIIALSGALFALSLSAGDVTDYEVGFLPLYAVLLAGEYAAPALWLAANPTAIDLELLEPNLAIFYLELHETSPPIIFSC